jgi:hypothetical protein
LPLVSGFQKFDLGHYQTRRRWLSDPVIADLAKIRILTNAC